MRRNRSYRRGDIFLADLGIPHGSEQGSRRPVIILQNDDGCLFSPTVTMVPLTTNLKKTYLKTHYGKKQMLSSMRQFADLVERYTDIREVSSELLHTLIDRIVIYEKEMEGDEMIMRVDVYYRFIGYVGDKTGDDMKAPQIRHRRWGKHICD